MMKKTTRMLLWAALLGWSAPAAAQELFKTPEEAASALVDAAKSGDAKALLAVLGPDGGAIVSSGDPVADQNAREKFVDAYDAKHTLELEGDGTQTLILGADDFPFPIPLVNKGGEWQFDTKAGADEILRRRVGRNELAAIQVAEAYVQAQNEYAALDPAGLGHGVYASRFLSNAGKKDGLYWPTATGETPSPLGDIAAKASVEGYKFGGKPIPYHGYYYRILTRQGAGAPGGAYDYLVNGKLRGGFALIAYPSAYGNSGIMTFMVNHDGTVFEKDLGPETGQLAPKIEAFLPDSTWSKATP
jgi:hypothetical protein